MLPTDVRTKGVLIRWAEASRVLDHLRLPLFRNGYALILSAAITSGLGMLYWAVAARFYPTEIVGLGSAALSAMVFLSGLSQLGLNTVLIRFVPLAGRRTARLIFGSYLISMAVAAVVSFVFTHSLDVWAPALSFLKTSGWQASFIVATMLWGVFVLQDSALTGLRQAVWVPVKNAVFAGVKFVLLIGLAGSFPAVGIFTSWNVPVILCVIPIELLIVKRLMPRHVDGLNERAAPLTLGPIVKYMGGNYVGSLFYQTSTTLLPIVVTTLAGAHANAYFYPPWMMVTALQLVAFNMATSLTVEATLDRARLSAYGRRALLQTARLVVPLVILIVLGAPLILQVFGKTYAAEGTTLLRLLALGILPNILVALFTGLARARNHAGWVMVVQGLVSVLTLGLSYSLLPTLGITGVGVAWLASQTIVAGLLLPMLLRSFLREPSRPADPAHISNGKDHDTGQHHH